MAEHRVKINVQDEVLHVRVAWTACVDGDELELGCRDLLQRVRQAGQGLVD